MGANLVVGEVYFSMLVSENLVLLRLWFTLHGSCQYESVGSISTAEGSALVRMGDTTVVCGVKAEIAEPELDRENEGFLGTSLT